MKIKNIVAVAGTLFAMTAFNSSWAAQDAHLEVAYNGFMVGCLGESANDPEMMAICECAYNSLLKAYGKQGIIDLHVKFLNPHAVPDEELLLNFQKAIDVCVK